MAKPKVLITGANGLIGSLTRKGLSDRYEFSGLSRHAVEGIPYTEASVTDLEAVRRSLLERVFEITVDPEDAVLARRALERMMAVPRDR